MNLNYDKVALQDYMDNMDIIGESMKRASDESYSLYKSCKQLYTRMHTELEQTLRKAYNKIEAAESLRRNAESEHDLAISVLGYSEDESERESARQRLAIAQAQLREAERDLAEASEQYNQAQERMADLTKTWEKHQQQLESAAINVEEGLSSFFTIVSNGNNDLNEYIAVMDKAQTVLYSNSGNYPTSNGKQGSPSSIAFHSKESTSSNQLIKTRAGNTLVTVPEAGLNSVLMSIDGKEYSFPNTKSGAAKAYRKAIKSGDSELISRTKEMFSSADLGLNKALPANQEYVVNTLAGLHEGLSRTIDKEMVMAGAEIRNMRIPNTQSTTGEVKGYWVESVFYLDDDFIPPYKNDRNQTVAEIRQELYDKCGIKLDGIPFVNGVADFSSISVASIPTKDIVLQSAGISSQKYDQLEPLERTKLFSNVFGEGKRSFNFALADRLAAERQLPIPGLRDGYSAQDVKEWRSNPEHRFTWDEQVNGGYNLVPTIIHGNVSHTGLVSSSTKAVEYFEERKNDSPQKYSWEDSEAPVSISEYIDKKNQK